LKKIFSVGQKIIVVLLGIILISNLYLLTMQLVFKQNLPKIFGYGQVIVISGSMEPTISAGDLLLIKQQNLYQVGDVVTYEWGNSLCTHRIVSIDGDQMITKGDANNTVDEPTAMSLIEGKVILNIPGFGNFILFLKTPFGLLLLAVLAIVLVEVPNLIKKIN
jgi:signal peptidase